MMSMLKDYAAILAPVLVAVVSGVFYLIKKGGNHNRQRIKGVRHSNVNQANGNIIINSSKQNESEKQARS